MCVCVCVRARACERARAFLLIVAGANARMHARTCGMSPYRNVIFRFGQRLTPTAYAVYLLLSSLHCVFPSPALQIPRSTG